MPGEFRGASVMCTWDRANGYAFILETKVLRLAAPNRAWLPLPSHPLCV
jgi:hypothetical protein